MIGGRKGKVVLARRGGEKRRGGEGGKGTMLRKGENAIREKRRRKEENVV